MTSGAFRAAYLELVPEFERSAHNKVVTVSGASLGDGPTTIPSRLARGEAADVVILADEALVELVKRGMVLPDSRVPLVRSSIAMAVRAGAPKPDISSLDALRRALLSAKSIAYSTSASGVYLSTELFHALGIAEQIRAKCRAIQGEPVGAVVARGEAELGFQQASELQPVPGITIVGPLPAGAQRVTVFSAGVVSYSRRPDAARELIRFFQSPGAITVIRKSGLEPFGTP
jgi:molybdate transport system substrate-binding protein